MVTAPEAQYQVHAKEPRQVMAAMGQESGGKMLLLCIRMPSRGSLNQMVSKHLIPFPH